MPDAATESDVALGLRNAVRFARMQTDEAMIGSQRRIVGVDGIERKIGGGGQVEHFRSGGFQLAAKFVMLRLRRREIRRMEKSQLPPAVRIGRLVPSRRAVASTPARAQVVRPWNGR